MRELTLENIRNAAIPVKIGTKDYWEREDRIGTVDMSREINRVTQNRPDGKFYSVGESLTIGFIVDRQFYALPATNGVVATLKKEGFEHATFYVPFSMGDIPIDYEGRWVQMLEAAKAENQKMFGHYCSQWSKKQGIEPIQLHIMESCFKIPTEGIKVFHPMMTEPFMLLSPLSNERRERIVDGTATMLLGTFTVNRNGSRTAFIAPNGDMMISKGSGIVSHLTRANYQETDLIPVFFSSDETIVDPALKEAWDEIPYI